MLLHVNQNCGTFLSFVVAEMVVKIDISLNKIFLRTFLFSTLAAKQQMKKFASNLFNLGWAPHIYTLLKPFEIVFFLFFQSICCGFHIRLLLISSAYFELNVYPERKRFPKDLQRTDFTLETSTAFFEFYCFFSERTLKWFQRRVFLIPLAVQLLRTTIYYEICLINLRAWKKGPSRLGSLRASASKICQHEMGVVGVGRARLVARPKF